MSLLPPELDDIRQRVLDDLYLFCKFVLGYNLLIPELHIPLCRFLQAPGNHKLVLMPRGYFKTTICTVGHALWKICKNRSVRILPVFNTHDNSQKRLITMKGHVETNRVFQLLFPDVQPDLNRAWSSEGLTFKHARFFDEPNIQAGGVNTDLTSLHFNHIGEDDPIAAKRNELTEEEIMPNVEDIDKGIGLHKMLGFLRAPDEPDLPFTRWYMGTRWCANDPANWIMDKEPQYDVFMRSAENEKGESAYPSMASTEELHRMRDVQYGPYMYASQMLLQPVPTALQCFKPEWLTLKWTERPAIVQRHVFVDPSHTKAGSGSKAAIVPVEVTTSGHVNILPCVSERFGSDEVVHATVAVAEWLGTRPNDTWEPPLVHIENYGGQKALRPYIMEAQSAEKPFGVRDAHHGKTNKDDHIRTLAVWFQAKRVRFPTYELDLNVRKLRADGSSGVVHLSAEPLRRQAKQFPFGREKDQLDALAYGPRVVRFPAQPEIEQARDPHSAQAAIAAILKRHVDTPPLPMTRRWTEYEMSRMGGGRAG